MNRTPSPCPSPPLGERVSDGRVRGIRAALAVILAFLALAVAQEASSAAAAADPPAPAGPKIAFASTVIDFGKIKSGEIAKHDFAFTNIGTATLKILAVRPGCGCTTAGAWSTNVEPGKTGIIPLQFNSTGFSGQVSKSAAVTCNDPASSNLTLLIRGTIWKPIDVTPTMAVFTPNAEASTNETKVLKIVNNLDEPISLSDLKCSHASFKAELKETKPGKEFDLAVTAMPPFTNPTVFASITLKTSSTNAPLLSVSAYATVQQPVMVSPQQITLPAGPLKDPVNFAAQVRINSTNAVEVSGLALDFPGVDVKLVPSVPGRLYTINLVFPAGFDLQPDRKLELIFKSNHPKYPVLRVPVVQMRPPPVVLRSTNAPTPLRTLPRPLMPQPTGRPAPSGQTGGVR